jgi:hypothetical protein
MGLALAAIVKGRTNAFCNYRQEMKEKMDIRAVGAKACVSNRCRTNR